MRMHKKRRGLPPLDLLRGFEAAARHLSFTKAGAELFLTQSAVSRQVQALEEALGVALFQRRHRALLLTDQGQMLYQTAAQVQRELQNTIERITGGSARMVTVTTMITFASLWLVPRLADFRRSHPDIDVRISANNEIVDMDRDRIDVAIRYVAPDRVQASAVKLFGEEVLPVCAPSLLKDRVRPLREPADLARHVLLHDDDSSISPSTFVQLPYLQWSVWLEAMGLPKLEPAGALHFSHYDQMVQAAAGGEGVALGRLPLLSRQIREGRLAAPFERDKFSGRAPTSSRAYFVMLASAATARPEVKLFVDWVLREARQDTLPSAVKQTARRSLPVSVRFARNSGRSRGP